MSLWFEFKTRFGTDEIAEILSALTTKFGQDWINGTNFDAQIGARLNLLTKATHRRLVISKGR